MNDISIFGGHGFILGRYVELFGGAVPDRDIILSKYPDIIYGISTTDNYNVFSNVGLDINTNLLLLMETLEKNKKKFGTDLSISFISSWFIYGKTTLPASENSCCKPMGMYGITKYCAEQLLISYCRTFGMTYRIMRLGNVLGVGDKKISCKKNALQFFVREIVNNRSVDLYFPNNTIRDYIYVDDVCNAINLVISSEVTKNQIYNIGNNRPVIFDDCVNYVVNKTGNFDCVKHIKRSEFHKIVQTNAMVLNNSKLQDLGYKQTKNIWQMLYELIEYYEREKNG